MRDTLIWLLHLVWPPMNENIPEYRWQVSMTVMTMTLTAGFTLWVAASTGQINLSLIPPRATQGDLAALATSQTEIKSYILGQSIESTRREQCAALQDSSAIAKSYTTQRLNDLLGKYRQITGENYRLPECVEIGS